MQMTLLWMLPQDVLQLVCRHLALRDLLAVRGCGSSSLRRAALKVPEVRFTLLLAKVRWAAAALEGGEKETTLASFAERLRRGDESDNFLQVDLLCERYPAVLGTDDSDGGDNSGGGTAADFRRRLQDRVATGGPTTDAASGLLLAGRFGDRSHLPDVLEYLLYEEENLLTRCALTFASADDLRTLTSGARIPEDLARTACLSGSLEMQPQFQVEADLIEGLIAIHDAVRAHGARKNSLRQEYFHSQLALHDLPAVLNTERCRAHDSRRVPLLLERLDGTRFSFHVDDNQRREGQPASTLLRMAAEIWKRERLPLFPVVGDVVLRGRACVVELVPGDVATLAELFLDQGGASRRPFPHYDWLYKTLTERCGDDFDTDLFCGSLAATLVFSYVFGLGDRHSDNIHLALPSGRVFTSDHYRFFGQYRKKFGFKRERPPFQVFSPEFHHVLEQEDMLQSLTQRLVDGIRAIQPHLHQFAAAIACLFPPEEAELGVAYLVHHLHVPLTRRDLLERVGEMLSETVRARKLAFCSGIIHLTRHE